MSYDPPNTKQFLSQIPPKWSFVAGIVLTITLLSFIGFILLIIAFLNNPSIVDSLGKENTTETNTNVAAAADPSPSPTTSADTIKIDSLDHVRGNGDITVVEYSDTECPFCKRFHPTMEQIINDYDGQVQWSYKHFPLASLHQKAQREAEATECAGEQGKFWEYLDKIFDVTPSNDGLEDSQLFSIADELGIDRKQFDECLESGKYTAKVQAEYQEAQNLGGTGTPFSVIIDAQGDVITSIPGALPYDQLSGALNQILAE